MGCEDAGGVIMCEHCTHEAGTRRATDAVRVARFLGAIGVTRETAPKNLDPATAAWLLAREEALIADLEPIVNEYGKVYFDEVKKALAEMVAKSGPLTDAQATALADALDATLKTAAGKFSTTAAPVVGEHAALAYGDVRIAKGVSVDLTKLVDRKAMKFMREDPVLWVKKHYADDLTATVRKVSARAIEQGIGREDLAARLEGLLGPQVEGYRYWDVVASSNLTRSRTWANNESYLEQGVEKMRWSTAADERVCLSCDALDGTVFSVQRAVDKQRGIIEKAPTPDEYKLLAPWVSTKKGEDGPTFWIAGEGDEDVDVTEQLGALTAGKADDGSALQDLGIDGPPGHALCRCNAEPID